MWRVIDQRFGLCAAVGGLFIGALGLGYGIGVASAPSGEASTSAAWHAWSTALDTSARGKDISLATGLIEQGIEGLFVLDHQTGALYCWIVSNRTGELTASFETNVTRDLGTEVGVNTDLVMTTGVMDFTFPRTGNMRPASCVVYVGEGNSGKVLAYALMYNPQVAALGGDQGGQLQLLMTSQTRPTDLRRDPN
jgi:hypothetical protein